MSRRRRGDRELPGSLFPFLSVLACVIGALTLLIAGLSIGRMSEGEDEIDWVAFEELEHALADDRLAIGTLEGQLVEGRALIAAAVDARQAQRVESRIAALESEHAELLKGIRDHRADLDRIQQSSSEESRIVVQPSGAGRERRPFFVECTGDALLVHKLGASWNVPVLREDMGRAFRSFLRGVKATPGAVVIFLIRPDGVDLYGDAERMADGMGVRHGKLPIPGQGRIDLQLFGGG